MQQRMSKILWLLGSFALFFYFWIGLLLAAQGKSFWVDESFGWFCTISMHPLDLLLQGAPDGQASKTPLPFLLDHLLASLWNGHPQQYWDLRLFCRIPPTLFWSLANAYLFFFLQKKFRPQVQNELFLFILSLAGTLFVFTNSFASYYAIEARPYSLWTSLTLVQTLFLWDLLTQRKTKSALWKFLGVNVLLALTTYASCLQIGVACGTLLLQEAWEKKRWKIWGETQKFIALTLFSCAGITLYYYAHLTKMNFHPAPLSLYFSSVLEVMLKSFHHHGYQPAFVSFPFFLLLIPYVWWKMDKRVFLLSIQPHFLLVITYLQYLASLAAQGIYASRYAAFMVPSLSFLYLLGIYTAIHWLAGKIEKRVGKPVLIPLLVLVSIINIIPWVMSISKGQLQDIARFQARNSYKENLHPRCLGPIEHDPLLLEQLNDFCRGL